MRFLMLNWRDPGNPLAGGAERVTLGYLAALAQRGHEVYWYANAFPGASPTATFEGVRVVRGGGRGTSILAARRWYRRQPRFDLVVDQHHGIPWFAPWWSGTRSIAYIHEVLGPIWNSFYSGPIAAIGRLQEAWVLRAYRKTPFWSACPSTKDALESLGIESVTLIPYGVATRVLDPLPPKQMEGDLRLVVVSRLAPNKRIDHCVEAVRLLAQRGVVASLAVVGGGECEASLREQVDRLGLGDRVRFCGRLSESEKDTLLQESHLLLHTSIREGWGLNVVEANCMGTPAVVYPVAGLRESTLDGQTGRVVREESPTALVEGILALRDDAGFYSTCRQKAWERAATFHWDAVLPDACRWLEAQAKGEAA